MSRDSIVTNFRNTGIKAGFKKEKNAYSFWRSHSLRKYFISTFINKKGEKIIADFMAGHQISEMDRTYWQANPQDLKKMYIDALPALSLDEANIKDYESEEFREVKKLNEKLIAKLELLTNRVNSIEEKDDDSIQVTDEDLDKMQQETKERFNNLLTGNETDDEKIDLYAEISSEIFNEYLENQNE